MFRSQSFCLISTGGATVDIIREYIQSQGQNDVKQNNKDVYKRSNVSSKSFSKIINGATKVPQKETVFGLCMGLMLNEQGARDLLASAGYAFNPLKQMDKFMLHCIRMRQYNVMEMILCRKAAEKLGLQFRLMINEQQLM